MDSQSTNKLYIKVETIYQYSVLYIQKKFKKQLRADGSNFHLTAIVQIEMAGKGGGHHCCSANCNNTSRRNKGKIFHGFPRNPIRYVRQQAHSRKNSPNLLKN